MRIIDASIAIKLINTQEEGSTAAFNLLLAHIKGEEKIIVPSLLFIEVANALATKSLVKEEHIKHGIHLLYEANFIIFDINEKMLIESSILAKKYGTSVYDMVYAVIAKDRDIKLVTADKKFAAKVNFKFIEVLAN